MRGHRHRQAAWAQPLANCCDTKCVHTSDTSADTSTSATKTLTPMDVDQGGRHPPLKCYSCGKLGHTAKLCRNKRQICGGDDLGDREKDFCGGVPMKVSPLEDYKQIQCINYGGDTGQMFPEAQNPIVFKLSIMFPNSFQNYDVLPFDHKNLKINMHQK